MKSLKKIQDLLIEEYLNKVKEREKWIAENKDLSETLGYAVDVLFLCGYKLILEILLVTKINSSPSKIAENSIGIQYEYKDLGKSIVEGLASGIISETSILQRVAKSLQFCPTCRRVYSNDEWRVHCRDCKTSCVDMLTEDEIIFLHKANPPTAKS